MDELHDDMVPRIDYGGLVHCCIQMIRNEGFDAVEGDVLDCYMCLTRVVFVGGVWQWDMTAWAQPVLPLDVPPPGVLVEDLPGGGGPPVPSSPPGGQGALSGTMMDPVRFKPAPGPGDMDVRDSSDQEE